MALRPGRQVVRVEVGEVDVALFVPDRRAQFFVDRHNGDFTLAELRVVRVRRCADRSRTCRNARYNAELVDRRNIRIARRPSDRAILYRQRRDLCIQSSSAASIDLNGRRSDRDAAYIVRIDFIADRGLDVQVDLIVGRGAQAERVVVIAQITRAAVQPVICCVIRPVAVGRRRIDRQRI